LVIKPYQGSRFILAFAVLHGLILREGFRINNAFLEERIQPFDSFLIIVRRRIVHQAAILLNHHIGATQIGNSKGIQQVHGKALCSAYGKLIIRIAVSIGILCFKSAENIGKLLNGGRFLQIQVIQPLFVDNRLIAGLRPGRKILWQGIDLSVREGNNGLKSGNDLHCCLQVGHILVHQIRQVQKQIRIIDDVRIIECFTSKNHIRQFVTGQKNGFLLTPVV